MKYKILKYFVLLTWIFLITACSSTRRFDYRTAYKFKYIKHEKLKDTLPPDQLTAMLPEQIELDQNIPVEHSLPGPDIDKKIEALSTTVIPEASRSEYIKPYHTLTKKEKKDLRKNTIRELKEAKKEYRKIKKRRRGGAWNDMHPRLKGFIWVAIGLGTVLVGVILIPAETISLIVVILGFGIVAFGFLKILGIIK